MDKLDVPYFTAHKLIGNAVPSLLGFQVGLAVASSLKKRKRIPRGKKRILNGHGENHVKSYRGSGKGRLTVIGGKAVLTQSKRSNN